MKKPVWRETEAFRPYSYIMDHIAKKDHSCKNCSQKIAAGDLYYEKKIMTPSYFFFSEKYCKNCYENIYIKKEIDNEDT